MLKQRALTELEGVVLGWVWSNGAGTPYEIRKFFVSSPSPHWSGSAGAIYPLVARLQRRGLLASRPHHTGRRRGRRFSLTPGGSRALAAWLSPPLGPEVLGIPPDPLRTRLPFLGALPRRTQEKFAAEAARELRKDLREARSRKARKRSAEWHEELLAEGVIAAMKARLDWMLSVAERLRRA